MSPSVPSSTSAPILCRLLAMCAHVAANLPYKRGDEVCYVLHSINSLISRRGDAVQTALKLALDNAAAGHPKQQVSLLSCLALCGAFGLQLGQSSSRAACCPSGRLRAPRYGLHVRWVGPQLPVCCVAEFCCLKARLPVSAASQPHSCAPGRAPCRGRPLFCCSTWFTASAIPELSMLRPSQLRD